jgi:hypothetical protein
MSKAIFIGDVRVENALLALVHSESAAELQFGGSTPTFQSRIVTPEDLHADAVLVAFALDDVASFARVEHHLPRALKMQKPTALLGVVRERARAVDQELVKQLALSYGLAYFEVDATLPSAGETLRQFVSKDVIGIGPRDDVAAPATAAYSLLLLVVLLIAVLVKGRWKRGALKKQADPAQSFPFPPHCTWHRSIAQLQTK